MVKQALLNYCLYIPLSPTLIHCLFKAKTHVCTLKMAEDELSAGPCNKPPFSFLCPSSSLFIYGISGQVAGPDT
jgi:hypothetical protein